MEDINNKPIKYINDNSLKKELSILVANLANLSATQIEGDAEMVITNLANYIMEINPMATLNDVRIAFRNAVKGHYGQFFKLSVVQMLHFVKEYFNTQTSKVNCHYYDDEPMVERNPLLDRKNFMKHMFEFHIDDRRIYGGWEYVYETMLAHGWVSVSELAGELNNAHKVLKAELESRKFSRPDMRREIDRELQELTDAGNMTLQYKAQELLCRRKFSEWHEQGVTGENIVAQTIKIK
jgi:hypothetical protein